MALSEILSALSSLAWGPGTIILLVGTGIYLTFRLGFVQFRMFWHALRVVGGKYDKPADAGEVSHFKALAAALSATIGTGNIAGVATAIVLGGPGAIFWMWVTALVGMATKFTSCSLALHFRKVNEDGSVSGGPMYFLERGFAPRWLSAFSGDERTRRWAVLLAMSFAFFGMVASFGIGNMVQANSVVDGVGYLLPEKWTKATYSMSLGQNVYSVSQVGLCTGLILSALVAMVILGGVKRIASVAGVIVPVMCVVYVAGALTVLVTNIKLIPEAFAMIFQYAFSTQAGVGGAAGITVMQAIRYGVARGVFSNESGMGSAPIAHAAAKTNEMAREGIVAMLGPFIDTIIVCTMTALVILITGVATSTEFDGTKLTAAAFEAGLGNKGHYIVGFGICFFAFSTMISWSYYGDRCTEYLLGPKAILPYRCVFVLLVVVGAVGGLRTIWTIADILNALMAIPNLIGLLALSGLAAKHLKDYNRRLKQGDFD